MTSSPAPSDPDREGLDRPEWEDRLLTGGEEPDPRFSLANERTFLAWIRTALALLAGGVAVAAFTGDAFAPAVRLGLSGLLLVMGAVLAVGAGARWLRIERALRHSRPLPMPVGILGVVVLTVAGTLGLLLATLLRGL